MSKQIQKSKNNLARRRAPRENRNNGVSLDPPPLRLVQPCSRTITWNATAGLIDFDITVNHLLRSLAVCSGTTSAYPVAYAVRMKKIRMWSTWQSSPLGNVAVEWNAGASGFLMDGVSVSDQSTSPARPARLSSRPPTESLGSWYQAGVTGGTNILCSITCSANTIIYIDYDYVPNLTEPGLAIFAVTAGVAGLVFAQHPSASLNVNPPLNALF